MDKPDKTNRQYRLADIRSWQELEFVIGFEIHRSNNPDTQCDICNCLIGRYPKSFIWTGWHDGCKCFLTSILMSPEEFNTDELNELKAAFRGTEYIPKEQDNTIKVLPKQFILWYANNVQQMLDMNVFPDFVRENIGLIRASLDYYKCIVNNGNS